MTVMSVLRTESDRTLPILLGAFSILRLYGVDRRAVLEGNYSPGGIKLVS